MSAILHRTKHAQQWLVWMLLVAMVAQCGIYSATVSMVASITRNHEVSVEWTGQQTTVHLHHSAAGDTVHRHAVEESVVLMLAGTDSTGDHVVHTEATVSKLDLGESLVRFSEAVLANLSPWEDLYFSEVWKSLTGIDARRFMAAQSRVAIFESLPLEASLTAMSCVQLLI